MFSILWTEVPWRWWPSVRGNRDGDLWYCDLRWIGVQVSLLSPFAAKCASDFFNKGMKDPEWRKQMYAELDARKVKA